MTIQRLLLAAFLIAGCGGSDSDNTARPDGTQACLSGATECRADGLYTCDASGAFQRTESCTRCEVAPMPHCYDACKDSGVTSVCSGDSIKQCASGEMQACDPGTCIAGAQQAFCATKPGELTCRGRRADGSKYALLCANANGEIASDQACDLSTSKCAADTFDCGQLSSVPANDFACDASGNYHTSCVGGQPAARACVGDTICSSGALGDSFNCYTPATPGVACGGPAVCYPGLHCTQNDTAGASCVQPAGQLACNSTDVLAVCTDTNTGVACVHGGVWFWRNLTTWGGSCTSNHVTLPAGGICIPGLADCAPGLECHRSIPYDVAGICRTPQPNAPAECTLTADLSTGLSCAIDWHACANGVYYDVDCRRVNVGGNAITICDCKENGTVIRSYGGAETCSLTTTTALDAKVRAECGWNLTTVDLAQGI